MHTNHLKQFVSSLILFIFSLHAFSQDSTETKYQTSVELISSLARNPKIESHDGPVKPETRTDVSLGLNVNFIHLYKTKNFILMGGFGAGNNTVTIAPKFPEAFYDSTFQNEKELRSTFLGTVYTSMHVNGELNILKHNRYVLSLTGQMQCRYYLPLDFGSWISITTDHDHLNVSYAELDNGWTNVPTLSFIPSIGFSVDTYRSSRKVLGFGISYKFGDFNFLETYRGYYLFLQGTSQESQGTFQLNEAGVVVALRYSFGSRPTSED